MKNKQMIFWTLLVLLTMTLWGCGSSRDSSGTVTGSTNDVLANAQTLGVVNCTKCHSAATPETLSWLQSTHGNSNGNLRYDSEPHSEGSSCQPCHNQLLDGNKMDQAFPPNLQIGTDDGTPTGVRIFANVSRDIVTCESCHGGGQLHSGVGPIPYTRPDWEQCVACHDHEGKRHEESFGNLASNIGASAHNNSDDLHASSAKCQRCHTAEGSVAFSQYTGDANVMAEMDAANDDVQPYDIEANMHPVTCAACHEPHTDALRADTFIVNDNALATGNWDPNGNTVADQFDFCTSCHTLFNQDGTLVGSGSVASGTAPFYHNTAWYRMIPSTHYDNPTTGVSLSTHVALDPEKTIEGYVLRQNSANPCFDCHGHELRTNTRRSRDTAAAGEETPQDYGYTLHTEWASSAHAGGLLNAKYAAADGQASRTEAQVDAVMAAGATDSPIGNAWAHYNWDADGRQSCQKCHTSTGVMNFLDSSETLKDTNLTNDVVYAAANNDFSHLEGWAADTVNGSNQNELLYCWGCHSNAQTGVMRTEEPITLDYMVDGVATDVTAPDGSSAACLSCHSGRGNMDSLLGATAADPAGAAVTGGTRTHYLTAGATIYQGITKIGYEYFDVNATDALGAPAPDFLNYDDVVYFGHDNLGCAECHMTTETIAGKASHTFGVVEKDATETITAISSQKCVECHDGEHALFVAASQVGEVLPIWNGTAAVNTTVTQTMADAAAAEMEHESHGYHDALSAMAAALTAAGTTPSLDYPYFVPTDPAVLTLGAAVTDQGHGGAMHNYSYLHHEPGAYAHNRFYAKRMIFDSIDWLTNPTDGLVDIAGSRTLSGSIFLDPATYGAAITWLGGDTVTGIISTRP